MGITGEYKVKRQKNGNEHYYVYYHCTRKNKLVKCKELCIRQESLDQQISSLLQKFSLREDWATDLLKMLEKDKLETAQSSAAFVQENRNKIAEIQAKLQRLLDGYLEQDIDKEVYREEKSKFLSEKKSLEEKITNLEQRRTGWIEPMSEWIKEARSLLKIARKSNLFSKKVAAKEIFGSNLVLANREAAIRPPSGLDSSPKIQWAAVAAAHKMAFKKSNSFILERVKGIEPSSRPWQGRVIAVIPHPLFVPRARLALATSAFSELRIYYLSYRGSFL
jgi:hypothetical protein